MAEVTRTRAAAKSLLIWAVILTTACVGSEPRDRRDEGEGGARLPPGASTSVGRDTVTPLTYQVFESKLTSETPKRALVRIMVMGDGTPDALSKTIRSALDSIGRADTTLAAARAVLYLIRAVGPMEGELVPRVWAEWTPPEGWEAAGRPSRRRPVYRTYIYHTNPGWDLTQGSKDG